MHSTFTKEPLHIDDVVVYLKNEITGSSTIRKCKFIGRIIDFNKTRVKIRQLSEPDRFVMPEDYKDYGEVFVYPHEIVNIIVSKRQKDDHMRTLKALVKIADEKNKDIYQFISKWFCALEDEGVNPWTDENCIKVANKYYYTEADYLDYRVQLMNERSGHYDEL
jgi:hypothetical protein